MNWIENIDKKLFLIINGLNNSFFDFIMYWISNKFFWIPFYVFLFYVIVKNFKKQTILILISILILTILTDQISVHLFKNVFMRYRPCHNIDLQSQVHLLNNYCGGVYGFVSSHAANTFGLATFLIFLFANKKWTILLFFWATIVSYSRIYAGVHYPLDVFIGGVLGVILAFLVFWLYRKLNKLKV